MKSTIFSSLAVALATISLASAQASGDINCFNGQPNTIQVADLSALINNLQTHNIGGTVTDPINLRSGFTINGPQSATFTQGSVQVELDNEQLFESTHVSFASLASALQDLMGVCCGSFPSCIGGNTGVAGDTGLVVKLTMSPN